MTINHRILLVDDSPAVMTDLQRLLPSEVGVERCDVDAVAQQAGVTSDDTDITVVILDMSRPSIEHLELAEDLVDKHPANKIFGLFEARVPFPLYKALQHGFDGYLVKPFAEHEIDELLERTRQPPSVLTRDDNVLMTLPSHDPSPGHEEYFSRLAELVGTELEALVNDGHFEYFIDLSSVPPTHMLVHLVTLMVEHAQMVQLRPRLICSAAVGAYLQGDSSTQHLNLYQSMDDARAAK